MNISDNVKQLGELVSAGDVILFVGGLVLLGVWFLRNNYGRDSLRHSVVRRNNMAIYLPFVPMFICFLAVPFGLWVSERFLGKLADWEVALLANGFLCLGSIFSGCVIVFIVRRCFARGVKGFGIDFRTVGRDIFWAAVNLISVLPLVLTGLFLTVVIGKLIFGGDFEIGRHEELELLAVNPELSVRVLIVITACVVVPIFEEMLFRGLFQSLIRSYISRAWVSIFLSSILFSISHANPAHWVGLFFLSVCLGYSYEKSGSLLRPMFIHAMFNTVSIAAALGAG